METSEHLGHRIIILSNQVKHYLHQASESEGISGSQGRILHFLAIESPKRDIYQKDVEDFFRLRRSTVTQNLQSMEKNGLIIRCTVEQDARLKKLVLTERGKTLEERIDTKIEKLETLLSDGLTKEEKEAFNTVLLKMNVNMKKSGITDKNHASERVEY